MRGVGIAVMGFALLCGRANADDGAPGESQPTLSADVPVQPVTEEESVEVPQDDDPGGDDTRVESVEHKWFIDFALGGGSVVGFSNPLSTGHLAWGGIFFHWDSFALGLSLSGTYPDSRVQTRFASASFDFRWYFLESRDAVRPYAVAGLGFSGGDELGARNPGTTVTRWAPNGSPFNVSPGVGIRWGAEPGFFVQVEARTVNGSHAVFALGAGFGL